MTLMTNEELNLLAHAVARNGRLVLTDVSADSPVIQGLIVTGYLMPIEDAEEFSATVTYCVTSRCRRLVEAYQSSPEA
ncbi:MAG: hypothetical protein U1E62_05540 [Alsobacter sp.]